MSSGIKLCKGPGQEGVAHCVMSATSIINEEPFSDNPVCVCPTIRNALIVVNDQCPNDEIRERLLGHLPWLIIGTRSPTAVVKRAHLFAQYADDVAARSADAAHAAAADAHAAVAAACVATYAADAAAHADATYAVDAAAATAHAAATDTAAATDAAAYADAWEQEMKRFVDFIEQEIIPVYTEMTVEPGYRLEKLCS